MKDINETFKAMNEGEKQLFFICQKYEEQGFVLIPNALFPRLGGGTSQLDLIMVSKKGIFVFEMKDFKGYITGDEYHNDWVQHLSTKKGKKKFKFRNPVKQNSNHIKTIKTLMSDKGIHLPIYNVVVFGLKAILGHVSSSTDVITLDQVDSCIAKYPSLNISENEVVRISDVIAFYDVDSPQAREDHLKYIDQIKRKNNSEKVERKTNKSNSFKVERSKKTDDSRGKNSIKHKLNIKKILPYLFLLLGFILPIGLVGKLVILVGVYGIIKLRKMNNREWLKFALGIFILSLLVGGWFDKISNYNEPPKVATTFNKTPKKSTGSNTIKKVNQSPVLKSEEDEVQEVDDLSPTVEEIEDDIIFEATIGLGVSKVMVENLAGVPDKYENNKSYYGRSTISFDDEGYVKGWNVLDNVLFSLFPQAIDSAEPIYFGSTKFEVLAAVGAPKYYDEDSQYNWKYSNGSVWFNEKEEVVGWYNWSNMLTNGLFKADKNAEPFFIGATKESVLKSLGSPTMVEYKKPNIWKYDSSYVEFDGNGLVSGWVNQNSKITKGLISAEVGAEPFNVGSSKNEVLKAMGAPQYYNESESTKWKWGNAYVVFDDEDKVIGWSNASNKLIGLRGRVEGSDKIRLGSTKENVIDALGLPSTYIEGSEFEFRYGSNSISFDENERVIGWTNFYGKLSYAFENEIPGAAVIDVGSSSEEVVKRIGTPYIIKSDEPRKWYYGNNFVLFNEEWDVESWFLYNNALKVDFVQ